jgi:hypothetical protein
MADIGISYSAQTSPSRVNAQLGIQFVGATLRVTIRNADNFAIKLTPSGNISEQILSGAAWPIAQTLGVALPPLAHNLIVGHSFDITTIDPMHQTVEGETVTVAVSDLHVSNFNGMLLIKGKVGVT